MMKKAGFNKILEIYPSILTEGSVIERLKRDYKYPLHRLLLNSVLIYDPEGKVILENIYREYIDIARSSDLPFLLLTPTWRANKERTALSNFDLKALNSDAFYFTDGIRNSYGKFADKIFIGGLTGCRGDAYKPEEALDENDAHDFHSEQVQILAGAGADFLFASTLPALSEARGIAKAMNETGKDYVISFVIRENGRLLDGTKLTDAIEIIDNSIPSPPLFYLTNCIHPDVLQNSFQNLNDKHNILEKRLLGIQANASAKSPEELDTLGELDADSPANWAKCMFGLHKRFNLRILGGCCGTDARFISSIADLLK